MIIQMIYRVFPYLSKRVIHTRIAKIVSKVCPSVACVVRGTVSGYIGVSLVC